MSCHNVQHKSINIMWYNGATAKNQTANRYTSRNKHEKIINHVAKSNLLEEYGIIYCPITVLKTGLVYFLSLGVMQ